MLFVNDGNFSKRMQDIIGQAGSGAEGGAGSIEATQLSQPPPELECQSQTE